MLANTDLLKNNISLNVANAYLTVLLANQTAEAALLQLHLSQNQLELTHKQVIAGTLPELNAAELESQVAQDSSTYIIDKSNVVQDILQLKGYMDLDAAIPFEVDTPPVDKIPIEQLADLQPDAVYALALAHQPLQKMDALQIQSDQRNGAGGEGGHVSRCQPVRQPELLLSEYARAGGSPYTARLSIPSDMWSAAVHP